MRVTPPVHRTPHGQSAGTRHSDPGKGLRPQFRCHRIPFDASSVVHCRSSLQSIHDVFISRLLTVTFTTATLKQLTAVWSLLLQAGSEGPSFISGTAPCSANTFLAQQTREIFET